VPKIQYFLKTAIENNSTLEPFTFMYKLLLQNHEYNTIANLNCREQFTKTTWFNLSLHHHALQLCGSAL